MFFSSTATKGVALLAGLLGASALTVTPANAESLGKKSSLFAEQHTTEAQMGETPMGDSTSAMTLSELANTKESFSTLNQAVQAANLGSTLSESGPYTVFAPTNEAFDRLPEGTVEFLLQPENQDLLRQVLTYHIISGEVTSSELSSGVVNSIGGGLSLDVSDSGVVVNNASVTNADIQASNGVVHVVNRVLIPEPLQQQLAERLGVNNIYE